MDMKFKKLLLLFMRMNYANQIKIKATPSKVINLQFFYNVMNLIHEQYYEIKYTYIYFSDNNENLQHCLFYARSIKSSS